MRALPPVAVSPIRLRHRDCPICGSDARKAAVLLYGRDPWTVMNCHGCGFAFLATVPETVELEETLAWETRHGEENARRRRDNPIQHGWTGPFDGGCTCCRARSRPTS